MDYYFLLVEFSVFILVVYAFAKKVQLSIIYLPLIIFSIETINTIVDPLIWYGIIFIFIVLYVVNNYNFILKNITAILLIIYFTILFFMSDDMARTITFYTKCVIWFVCLPLIIMIYEKYDRDIVMKEINFVSLSILILYCTNVLFATLTGYSPREMYADTWWIKFGNMFATNFNILPVALFGFLYTTKIKNKVLLTSMTLLFLFMIIVPFRRSVLIALAIVLLCLVFYNIKYNSYVNILMYLSTIIVLVSIMLIFTNVFQIINERVEKRNIQERGFVELEESRFLEYQIIFADMFIYKDYSPIFGYGFFDSWGNYGRGVFGKERSLHADLTSIAHTGGLLAVLLYLLMIYHAKIYVYKKSMHQDKYIILLFFILTLIVFTITGRYTETGYKIMLFLILFIPLCEQNNGDE